MTEYANMTTIVKDGGALSAIKMYDGWNVVRPTTDGQFAVIACHGTKARIVKILPTLDRARAYNFAMSR